MELEKYIEYIEEARRRGFKDDVIRKSLLDKGWPKKEVEAAFEYVIKKNLNESIEEDEFENKINKYGEEREEPDMIDGSEAKINVKINQDDEFKIPEIPKKEDYMDKEYKIPKKAEKEEDEGRVIYGRKEDDKFLYTNYDRKGHVKLSEKEEEDEEESEEVEETPKIKKPKELPRTMMMPNKKIFSSDNNEERRYSDKFTKEVYGSAIPIYLDDDLKQALEKRAKKNMMKLPELIEDILRRSTLSMKANKGSVNEKLDDTLVGLFSRKNTGPKKKNKAKKESKKKKGKKG